MTDLKASGAAKTVSISALGGGSALAGGYLTFSPVATTPEPSTLLLLSSALVGLGLFRKRRTST